MEKGQALFYRVASHIIALPFAGKFLKLRCEGEENIPPKGKILVVANHRSWLDPVVMAMEISRPINFLAASFMFDVPGAGQVFKNAGVLPLHVEGKGNEGSLRQCIRLLQEEEAVGVYPEGVQNFMDPDGKRIKSFHTGFARIALACGAPIVPAAVVGVQEAEDKLTERLGKLFLDPMWNNVTLKLITYKKVYIKIGKPIYLDEYYHQMYSKQLLNTIAGRVRRVIINLYEEGMKKSEGLLEYKL